MIVDRQGISFQGLLKSMSDPVFLSTAGRLLKISKRKESAEAALSAMMSANQFYNSIIGLKMWL